MFTTTQRRNSVFKNEQTLSTTDLAEPIGRQHEIDILADALRPLTRGRNPENLFAYGPTGTGKTTCIRHVCCKLEEETRVKTVTINCWKHNTRSSLLTQLLIELGYPVPRKGIPVDALLTKLHEWIEKHHSIVVVLDEFDQHQEQSESVYDLHELAVETENSLSMILISNTSPSQIDLEPRSLSRLDYQRLHFEPYSEEDLKQILKQRAQQAFHRNTLGDNVVDQIAAKVSNERDVGRGDCRRALELLYRAGREADREQADKVTTTHVERAIDPPGSQKE